MVKLTEVEDEHFAEKPATTNDDSLLADDNEDYTDTDSSLSDDDDFPSSTVSPSESLTDRIYALKDMIPPKTRNQISAMASTGYGAASKGINYGGKGLWIICTSVLLFGMPYALAMGSEQEMLEQERQQQMINEGGGMLQDGVPQAAGGEGQMA